MVILRYAAFLVRFIFGVMHLCCDAPLVSCIYDDNKTVGAMHHWCGESLLRYIFGAYLLHCMFGAYFLHCMFGVMHLWCIVILVRCIYGAYLVGCMSDAMHLWCGDDLVAHCIFGMVIL